MCDDATRVSGVCVWLTHTNLWLYYFVPSLLTSSCCLHMRRPEHFDIVEEPFPGLPADNPDAYVVHNLVFVRAGMSLFMSCVIVLV